MKKITLLVSALLMVVSLSFGQEVSKDTAVLSFDKPVFDVGTITAGSHDFEFTFTNTGKGILQITNVAPTCGCTIASWTKEPLKPGEKGVVKAKFNGYSVGAFSKSLTVYSNSKTPVTSLSFKGTIVDPAKDASKSEATAAETTTNPDKK